MGLDELWLINNLDKEVVEEVMFVWRGHTHVGALKVPRFGWCIGDVRCAEKAKKREEISHYKNAPLALTELAQTLVVVP